MERAQRGDREAFASLVHQVSDRLYAVALRILRDPGSPRTRSRTPSSRRGATSRACGTRSLRRLDPPGPREQLLHRTSPRDATGRSTSGSLPGDGAGNPRSQPRDVDWDELEQAFGRLPLDQRAVFVLHHYRGLPLVEIAETLGIPAGTARSRLHYATRAIRLAIEADRMPIGRGRTPRMSDERMLERIGPRVARCRPDRIPERVVQSAFLEIETTSQVRDLRVPVEVPCPWPPSLALWRAAPWSIALAAGGALLLARRTGPTPWPSVGRNTAGARRRAPCRVLSTTSTARADEPDRHWQSERYALGAIDPSWTVTPAALTWTGPDNSDPVIDQFAVTGTTTVITAGSEPLLPGQTFDAWLDTFQPRDLVTQVALAARRPRGHRSRSLATLGAGSRCALARLR